MKNIKNFSTFINEAKGVNIDGININNSDLILSVKRTSTVEEFISKIEKLYDINFSKMGVDQLKTEYKNIIN